MIIALGHAVEGYNLHLQAEGRSVHTIGDYNVTLERFVRFIGPLVRLDTIAPDDVRRFLAYWQGADVTPAGVAPRPTRKLAAKTIKNMHTGLSSFFAWAQREGYVEDNPIHGRVQSPRSTPPPVDPLTDDQVRSLVAAARTERDQAIILFLLDTGARASELCGMTRGQLDVGQRSAMVLGKGNKRRLLPFGAKTGRMMFRYLASRNGEGPDAAVFQTRDGGALDRRTLLDIIQTTGERAGIGNCYPHRLRHTFAITYLRNGGDIYTLQAILGHSSLDMVKRYLAIAGADVRLVHRRASPIDNIM